MSVTTLFDFHFTADLDAYHVRLLREATGLRIGDTDDLSKDTPGKGRLAPGVNLHLWRPGDEPDDWRLDATTRQDTYDVAAVTACRDRLREVLPRIARRWEEKSRYRPR
jgi:hypothetical protein